jgi:dTDP-4-dehydrorhamnose 3,5-epimerase
MAALPSRRYRHPRQQFRKETQVKYTPTSIAGVTIIDIEATRDHRGFVSQAFSAQEFTKFGLIADLVQTTICFNYTRGTVRGLHRQAPPYAQAKLVRCTRGAIADVAVDVRPESPTFGKHVMVELTADNHRALFIPPYVAHGFQTLQDETEVSCQVSGAQVPADEEGFRFNEPEFGIKWPVPVTVISEQDASWPKSTSAERDVVVVMDVDRLRADRQAYDLPAVPARIAPARRPVHLSDCAAPVASRRGSEERPHHQESGTA